jgi:hypothetical protein
MLSNASNIYVAREDADNMPKTGERGKKGAWNIVQWGLITAPKKENSQRRGYQSDDGSAC